MFFIVIQFPWSRETLICLPSLFSIWLCQARENNMAFLKKKKNRTTMWSNSLTPSYISEGCVANILDHIMTCHSFSFKDFLKLSFWRECQINSMFIDRIFQKTVLKSNICCFHHVIFSRLNIFRECLTRSSSKLL